MGVVKYNYLCVLDEKARLGIDFVWGVQSTPADQGTGSTGSGGTTTNPDVTVDTDDTATGTDDGTVTEESEEPEEESNEFDFFDDLTETERVTAYITFGFNVIFFISCIAFLVFRFCCNQSVKEEQPKSRFV